jgi:hypothetical protein
MYLESISTDGDETWPGQITGPSLAAFRVAAKSECPASVVAKECLCAAIYPDCAVDEVGVRALGYWLSIVQRTHFVSILKYIFNA